MHEKVFADPLNEHITTSSFAEERSSVVEKVENLRKYRYLLQALFVLSIIAPAWYILVLTRERALSIFNAIFFTFIGFFGMALLNYALRSLQDDLVLYLLCEKNNWVCNPAHDKSRPQRMAQLFPHVFERGFRDSWRFDNQIWGMIGKNEQISFWCCNFYYELPSNTNYQYMRNRIPLDRSDMQKTVFVLELVDIIPYTFELKIRAAYKNESNVYKSGTDLKTESVDFNERIDVKIPGASKETKRQVLHVLSPSVQVRLVDFVKKYPIESITFQHNCMVVVFEGLIWETKHTNFLKRVMIDERDLKSFDSLFKSMIELPLEMRKYLD